MKDKIARQPEKIKGPKFVACGVVTGGGIFHGGSECIGGSRVSMEVQSRYDPILRRKVVFYGGKPQRVAQDCQCLIDYRAGQYRRPQTEPVEYVAVAEVIAQVNAARIKRFAKTGEDGYHGDF